MRKKLDLGAVPACAEAEFDRPVEAAEPLRFILPSLADAVCRQLGERQQLCVRLRVELAVDGITAHRDTREVRPAPPTADARVLAGLCRSAIGAPPPDGPLRGVRLEAVEVVAASTEQ